MSVEFHQKFKPTSMGTAMQHDDPVAVGLLDVVAVVERLLLDVDAMERLVRRWSTKREHLLASWALEIRAASRRLTLVFSTHDAMLTKDSGDGRTN